MKASRIIGWIFPAVLPGCNPAVTLPPPAPAPEIATTEQRDGGADASPDAAPAEGTARQIKRDALAVMPLVQSPLATRFLAATAALPEIAPRMLYHDAGKTIAVNAREAARMAEDKRKTLVPYPADETFYYTTRYGSPLSYARALDLLGQAGLGPVPGTRLFDFGFGGIGHLRLLASLGMHVTGNDIDPLLQALYSEPGDQGTIAGHEGPAGQIKLVFGHYPGERDVVVGVGGGYDVILSKNVLKKGYIHPDRPAEKRFLIDLGVEDSVFLKAIWSALKPGGRFLIYNICPAPSPPDKPFVPWSDGRSPFTTAQFEAAGFRIVTFDREDTAAVRALGHALHWDQGEDAMDLQNDLSVLYTLAEKPAG
jgi:SAM-dependent methyltransferase